MMEKLPGSEQSSSDENQYVEGDSKEGEQANEAQQVGYRPGLTWDNRELKYRVQTSNDKRQEKKIYTIRQ